MKFQVEITHPKTGVKYAVDVNAENKLEAIEIVRTEYPGWKISEPATFYEYKET